MKLPEKLVAMMSWISEPMQQPHTKSIYALGPRLGFKPDSDILPTFWKFLWGGGQKVHLALIFDLSLL